MSFLTRKPDPIDRRRSLAGIPIVNEAMQVERDGDRVVLTVTWGRGTGILARFQPPVLKRRVRLDELGTFVFEQIDGKRTVLEIIDRFVIRFKTNRREAELSVVAFIKSLVERRVVALAIAE